MLAAVLAIAAGAGLAVLVSAQGGPSALVDSNLDRGAGPFTVERDASVTMEYVGGGYRMLLSGSPQESRTFWDPAEPSIVVAADATVVNDAVGSYFVAVGCVAARGSYEFALAGNGATALFRSDGGGRSPLMLGDTVPLTPTSRLELRCRSGVDGVTSVVGSVNGVVVLRHEDGAGLGSFRGMALLAASGTGPLDVMWDNPFADRLGGAE